MSRGRGEVEWGRVGSAFRCFPSPVFSLRFEEGIALAPLARVGDPVVL